MAVDLLDWPRDASRARDERCQRRRIDLELPQTSRIDHLVSLVAIDAQCPTRWPILRNRQVTDAVEPPDLSQDATGKQAFDQSGIGAVEVDPIQMPDRVAITLPQQRAKQGVGGRGHCDADAP